MKSEFSTFERRMEILSILINQRLISCPELARRFSVSDDTITGVISVLSGFAPIGSKIGRYGGVYIINEYKREGITDSNSCAQCLLNFRSAVLSGFARRQDSEPFLTQKFAKKMFSRAILPYRAVAKAGKSTKSIVTKITAALTETDPNLTTCWRIVNREKSI